MSVRSAVVAGLGAAAVFGGSFGILDLGLRTPTAGERVGVRVLATLERTRGVRAALDVDGHRLVAECRSSRGRDVFRFSDGSRILLVGVHTTPGPPATRAQSVSALGNPLPVAGGELAAAKAAVAGSHAYWSRLLAARLEEGHLVVAHAVFRATPVYELRLSPRPRLELLVDRRTLLPLAATFRSRSISVASRLLRSRHAIRGC